MKITISIFLTLMAYLDVAAQDSLTARKYENALNYVQSVTSLNEHHINFEFCQGRIRYNSEVSKVDSVIIDSMQRELWPSDVAVSPLKFKHNNFYDVSHDYIIQNYNMTAEEVIANYKLVERVIDSVEQIWVNPKELKGGDAINHLSSKRETGFILFFSYLHKDESFLSADLNWYCHNYSNHYSQLPSIKYLFEFDEAGEIKGVYTTRAVP